MNPIKQLPKIIYTTRLELRQLDAVDANASLIYNAVKNENPDDFYFNPISTKTVIPTSVGEMLNTMLTQEKYAAETGVNYYIFLDGQIIGYRRLFFHNDATKTLQSASVWLIKSAWGKGYGQETMKKIEEIAFNTLGALRITRQCDAKNTRSINSIKSDGYHLDGISRQGDMHFDGTVYDNMFWSKLKSEYK